jgi:hypothetical protein
MKHQILLDTNIAVDILRAQRSSRPKTKESAFNYSSAVLLVEKLLKNKIQICFSVITLKELLQYPNISPEEERRINEIFPEFSNFLPINESIARKTAVYSRKSSSYRKDHIEDCYIAATAATYNLPLYTRNPKDFKYVEDENLIVEVPYRYKLSVTT